MASEVGLHRLTFSRRFEKFLPSFFSHSILRVHLKGVVFVDRRNGFRGSHSALFDVDSTGFWSIDFFSPPTLRVAIGGRRRFAPELLRSQIIIRGVLQVSKVGPVQICDLHLTTFPCKTGTPDREM